MTGQIVEVDGVRWTVRHELRASPAAMVPFEGPKQEFTHTRYRVESEDRRVRDFAVFDHESGGEALLIEKIRTAVDV